MKIPMTEINLSLDGIKMLVPMLGLEKLGTNIGVSKFSVDKNTCTPVDVHDDHEIWFIHEGEGLLTLDGEDKIARMGDFLYFKPNSKHTILNTSSSQLCIISIWWINA